MTGCESACSCDSLQSMAHSGRFGLSVRVLRVLAAEPEGMHTSTAIAEELGASAVMVRRTFLLLQKAGLITQRKGPSGGARLKVPAKQIGMGTVFTAAEGEWLRFGEESGALTSIEKRLRKDALEAMNGTTLAQITKKAQKG